MGHSSVTFVAVAVVVVKRQKQDEGPISRDDRGFVLVVCVLDFLAGGSPLALPIAKHEVNSIGIIVRSSAPTSLLARNKW